MKLADKSKKYKYSDGSDRPDDKLIPFLDNEFVTGFKEDRLFYSKDFDGCGKAPPYEKRFIF